MVIIGGDSFGVHVSREECQSHDMSYTWYQQILKQKNIECVNVAVGGSCIYSSVFRCVQSIIKNPGTFTHCMFFITDFHRDLTNTQPDIHRYLDSAYRLEAPKAYMNYDFRNDESVGNRMDVLGNNKIEDPNWSYFKNSSMFKLYMAGLSCLSQLSTVCERNNIKLMWVHTNFISQINLIKEWSGHLFAQPYKDFVYTDVITTEFTKPHDKHWRARQDNPGHMTGTEQIHLLREFKYNHLHWLE